MKSTIIARSILASLVLVVLLISNSYSQEAENEQGNLTFIVHHNVSPANRAEYVEWIKQFKAVADETNGPNFSVGSSDDGFSFFMGIGKTMAGHDEINKKFGEWFSSNEKLMELNNKYDHTITSQTTEVWRNSPSQTYAPEGYDNSVSRPYSRVDFNWIKSGSLQVANEVIKEYLATWTSAGISESTRSYWNIFGTEQECVAFVTSYASRDAWLASQKEVGEKVGKEKLNELQKKWNAVLRKTETIESWDRSDLSHSND